MRSQDKHENSPVSNISRRQFLRTALGASAAPLVMPASVLGRAGGVAPGNRITMGFIGLGGMGTNNLKSFLGIPDAEVVALCDVNRETTTYGYGHDGTAGWEPARHIIEQAYGDRAPSGSWKGVAVHRDFRELLARDDIDAVCICTPDHWHAAHGVAALRAGKDVYGEKPLTRTIREGRILTDTVKRYGRVWQTGSFQRSDARFIHATELVRNGHIGTVRRVKVGLPANQACEPKPPEIPPPGLDWDAWLGPAPWAPYHPWRAFTTWRFISDYSAGKIADWGAHHLDIAMWGIGMETSGPVKIKATRCEYPKAGLYDHPTDFEVDFTFASGAVVTLSDAFRRGCEWIGDDGSVFVSRGTLETKPGELRRESIAVTEDRVHAHSVSHHQNFIDCVRNRRETAAPVEIAHRTNTGTLLGEIACRTGRTIRWDPATETILDDPGAAAMLSRPYRAPWTL